MSTFSIQLLDFVDIIFLCSFVPISVARYRMGQRYPVLSRFQLYATFGGAVARLRISTRECAVMENSTGVSRRVRVSDSGRILTPDEAAFLEKYLLGSKPLIIVGDESSHDAKSERDSFDTALRKTS